MAQLVIPKKVVYAHPDASHWKVDNDAAREHLVLGKTYFVWKIEMRSYGTMLWLKGIPEHFNSLNFDAPDAEEAEVS